MRLRNKRFLRLSFCQKLNRWLLRHLGRITMKSELKNYSLSTVASLSSLPAAGVLLFPQPLAALCQLSARPFRRLLAALCQLSALPLPRLLAALCRLCALPFPRLLAALWQLLLLCRWVCLVCVSAFRSVLLARFSRFVWFVSARYSQFCWHAFISKKSMFHFVPDFPHLSSKEVMSFCVSASSFLLLTRFYRFLWFIRIHEFLCQRLVLPFADTLLSVSLVHKSSWVSPTWSHHAEFR